MLVPVLLSGGSGTRLWPVSRKSYPKQFVNLIDPHRSLLQMTAQRLKHFSVEHSGWLVVCSDEHRFLVAEQLQEISVNVEEIILEPVGRNTAPAVAVAAIQALKKYSNAKLLVQTADHIIPDEVYFADAVERALRAEKPIVTFGVKPTRPETGYGYIELESNDTQLSDVVSFVEKPDEIKAQAFVEAGNCMWNSGMFLLDAQAYLDELAEHAPAILGACRKACDESVQDLDFTRLSSTAFESCPSDSIDYAVMEKSNQVSVLSYQSEWSDLGAWDAVHNHILADSNGNVVVGSGVVNDSKNCFVRADGRVVALTGVKNLCVVETADAILVADRNDTQSVKHVVDTLRSQNRTCSDEHVVGYRPWGTYERLALGARFQVKRIVVKPGCSLSLQMHHHRAEHWVVVEGTAEVTNGDETFFMTEDQSTYIPIGQTHRLSNPGKQDLILVEVQSGSYLGEDDIVRLEDIYARS